MELTINRHPDENRGVTLRLVGSIDLMTRQSVVDAGLEILRAGDALTLDLGQVDFMDSTGIGALVELSSAATSTGSGLLITERSERVTRILEATGLDTAWEQPDGTLGVAPSGDRARSVSSAEQPGSE